MKLTFKQSLSNASEGFFHHLVKVALEKEGWTITHDPDRID
ncbi:MAG: element excision factor XisH family protein [Cyanobacteriota bacterium]|nr:element excision factor XisH family protein [Cyanobacteriota bacterium]